MINEKSRELGTHSSAIRELFSYGLERKKIIGEENVFDFSIGNPSVPAPSIVNETLISLINETNSTKLHGYSVAEGDFEVREAVSNYLNKTYQASIDPSYIYLSTGAAAGLSTVFNALLNNGDEVIVIAPYFPEYKVFIEKAGGVVVAVLGDEKTFELSVENIEKIISPKTKAIVINYPNNPTGALLNEDGMTTLAKFLRKMEAIYQHDIYIISDEPYRELVYDDIKYPFITNYYDNSIVCYSFSKCLSIPGERIGYIIVNKTCNDAKGVYNAVKGSARSLGYICAPVLFQKMIPACLGFTSDLSIYKKNRDLLTANLLKIGYEVVKPGGAFYLFVKALEHDAKHFSEVAKRFELLLVPSDSFGCEGYVRISYCVNTDVITRSIEAFKQLYLFYQTGEANEGNRKSA